MNVAASPGQTEAARLLSRAAARHLGFSPEVFNAWICAGLLPGPSVDGQFWTAADLDNALDRLQREGHPPSITAQKKHQYLTLPNVHPPRRKVNHGGYNGYKRYYYFRPTGEPLAGSPGSPEFMRNLLRAERERAQQQKQATPPEQTHKQSPSPTQQSQTAPSTASEFVVQNNGGRRSKSEPRDLLVVRRRRTTITQADIARIIRAAKQAGAAQIEVRLNDSSTVLIRLQPDNSLAQSEEIVL